jgi:hypothetical protein
MPRHPISYSDVGKLEVDDAGRLFWEGKAVVTENRITLRGWELTIAGAAALGALLAGIHPFLHSFGWIR